MHQASKRRRHDWPEVARAIRMLLKDPNDVSQVYRIVDALPGYSMEWVAWRMKKRPDSARRRREQPSMLPLLRDRAGLAAMPEGSLGRAYLSLVTAVNISAEGMLEAAAAVEPSSHQTTLET